MSPLTNSVGEEVYQINTQKIERSGTVMTRIATVPAPVATTTDMLGAETIVLDPDRTIVTVRGTGIQILEGLVVVMADSAVETRARMIHRSNTKAVAP